MKTSCAGDICWIEEGGKCDGTAQQPSRSFLSVIDLIILIYYTMWLGCCHINYHEKKRKKICDMNCKFILAPFCLDKYPAICGLEKPQPRSVF